MWRKIYHKCLPYFVLTHHKNINKARLQNLNCQIVCTNLMLNMFWIQNINIFIDPRGGEMKIQLNYRLCKLCSQSNLRFVIANWCCLRTADCRLNIKIQLYLQQSSPRHPATSPSTPPHLLTLTGVTRLKLIVLWLNGGMFHVPRNLQQLSRDKINVHICM